LAIIVVTPMEQQRGHASAFEKTKVMIGILLKKGELMRNRRTLLGPVAELALSHLQLC
jgi:hypothetical protein